MPVRFSKILRKWFLSIDQVLLFSVFALISVGAWISVALTPSVATKLGFAPFHFAKLHLLIIPVAILIMLITSALRLKYIGKLAVVGYLVCLALVICTLFWGAEIKGARRWLSIFGFSLQPSEFLKPITAVISAWLISEQYRDHTFPGILLSIGGIALIIPFLLLQPDVGMTVIIVGTLFAQFFISGLSISMIVAVTASLASAMFGLYLTLPHFADRIDKFFIKNEDTDIYQIQKSIDAFKHGGMFGKNSVGGGMKAIVPDSHSDFVFSIIGEEYGFAMCLIIVVLFVTFVTRAMVKVIRSANIFTFTAVFGILFQIASQVVINICTTLNLIPTKGMTLPFISYGGSSMLSSAVSVGIILALTKKNNLQQDTL